MNTTLRMIMCILFGTLQLGTAGEPDIPLMLSHLKLTMTPADASRVMKAEGAELLADGTVVGGWGSIPYFPGNLVDVTSKLGIEEPQAAQVWKIGERWIRLHYAPNKKSKQKNPILFWIEVMELPSKDSKGNINPDANPPSELIPPK